MSNSQPNIRFATIGLNHEHIYGQTTALLNAGAELISVYAEEVGLLSEYTQQFPQAVIAPEERTILEDESIHLIISASIPSERAPLGIKAMQHGKDFMSDKPAFTSMEQLNEAKRAQAETGQIYSVNYAGRLESRATTKAGELVHSGAIGEVIHTTGLGPHRIRLHTRPEWFFQREKYGGILIDVGAHQFDQFLHFTGAQQAEIVAAQVANYQHPQYPELEDFGDVMIRAEGCSGYMRMDWFTPDGLESWGDTRFTVIGTEGYIELRKNCDIAGRSGGDHLFLVDQQGSHYIDCQDVELPYVPRLIEDILNRTETAMSQKQCFLASELALLAQAKAERLGYLSE